jgi:hypothetical protein
MEPYCLMRNNSTKMLMALLEIHFWAESVLVSLSTTNTAKFSRPISDWIKQPSNLQKEMR